MSRRYILLVLFCLCLVSCQKEWVKGCPEMSGQELAFSVNGPSVSTRSTTTVLDSLERNGFNAMGNIGTRQFFSSSVTKTDGTFKPTGKVLVPSSDDFRICAVYPDTLPIAFDEGSASLSYAVDDDMDVVAVSAECGAGTNPVPLTFNHILGRVCLKCRGSDPNVSYVVESVSIDAKPTGTYSFDDGQWNSSGTPVSYEFFSGSKAISTSGYTVFDEISTFIPETVTMSLSWNCLSHGQVVGAYAETFDVILTQGKSTMVACALYNNDTEDIDFEVSVNEWEGESIDIEINELQLDRSVQNISDQGGSFTINVKNDSGDNITASTDEDWISIHRMKSSCDFDITVSPNGTFSARSGIIRFSDSKNLAEFTVKQKGLPETFSIDKASIIVNHLEPVTVTVTANVPYTARTDDDWIEISNDGDIYGIMATAATPLSSRNGSVLFESEAGTVLTLSVTQTETAFQVGQTNFIFDSGQHDFSTTVTTTAASYSVSYEGDWLCENGHSGNTWSFHVQTNEGSSLREGAVVFHYDGLEYRIFVKQFQPQTLSSYLLATYNAKTPTTKIINDASQIYRMYVDENPTPVEPAKDFAFSGYGNHTVKFIFKTGYISLANIFSQCTDLTAVDGTHFSDVVSNMSYMFDQCTSLRSVTGVSHWKTTSLESTNPGWKTVSLNGGAIGMFQNCTSLEHLEFTDMDTVYSCMYNHLSGCDDATVVIPDHVTKISGCHTFYNVGKDNVFTAFAVESGNTSFKTAGGCLYSMDGTEFVACPRSPAVSNHTLEVAEGVTKFGELCFNRENTFTRLLLPDSYVITEYTSGDRGEGMNKGNSLSVALYCFTAVNEYAVKSSNQNYITDSGCVYSKDGTHLVAVPYNCSGALHIRNGCTHINREAFWCGGYDALPLTTSLSIPSSVTSIESGQMALINRAISEHGLVLTVDAGNPVYEVSGGLLVSK